MDSFTRDTFEPEFLFKAQHAYIKSKSIESDLHEVVFQIEHSLNYKDYILGTFLDIAGVFNNGTAME